MATPLLVVDGVDEFEAVVSNKALSSDGVKLGVKTWHARIRFDGVSFVVEGTTDSAGITGGGISFNGGTTQLEITLSGFTNAPVVMLTSVGTPAYNVKVVTTTNVLTAIRFYDIASGAEIVTGVGDINMDFNVYIIGE